VKRLSELADDEVELFIEATASERADLMWAAACRRYELIGEFAEEVLRERFLLLAATLGYEDFDSFVRTKALWHDELATIKNSTRQRLRSNLFKMLREAELLSEAGYIVPAVLSERVVAVLSARAPGDLRFFPTHQNKVQGAVL
jgi:BrxA